MVVSHRTARNVFLWMRTAIPAGFYCMKKKFRRQYLLCPGRASNAPVRMKELLEKPQLSIYFSLEGDTGAESATDLLMLKGQQHLIELQTIF